MPSPFDAPVAPPSFTPQISSLGTMIDHFAQRRAELQQQQDQAEMAQANLDRQVARDKEREAYGRRKQDIAEKKVDAESAYKRAQATQLSLKEAKAAIARGQHPGTMLVQGPDGNPVYVDWKFVGGQQPQAPQAAPPSAPPEAQAPAPPAPAQPQTSPQPSMGGPSVMNLPFAMAQKRLPSPVATATPDGKTQVDPQLEALMARAEQPASGSKDPVFLDRTDEGRSTVLAGPDGGKRMDLPSQSLPPGAKEGQTFNAEDVNLRGGKGNPYAGPVPGAAIPEPSYQGDGEDNSIFLDRNDEGTATALSGPEGEVRQELPMRAFPEGAKEGQSFAPEDVNQRGGFGNPFSGPLPPKGSPEFGNGMLPNGSGTIFVPPRDIRGMSMRMDQPGQPQGGRWEARLPDGQVITVDPNEARAAKRDQDAQDLRETDVALADPATKLSPQLFNYYVQKKQAILGGMSSSELKQVYAQAGKVELQGNQIASNEKVAEEKIAAQKSIAELRRKKGHSGALVPPAAATEGSAYQKLFSQDPFKAEKLATQVDAQIGRSLKNMNWDKLQGIGTNRLSIALRNLDLGTGTGQFDAMMGFFGYLRGGVPAKNETDEWKSMTSTAETFLNKIGRKLKLGNIGTLAASGGDLTPEQKKALSEQVTGMDPSQATEMRAAIVESQKALQDFAENAAESVRSQYANRAPAEKELAEGKIAGLLQYAGKARTKGGSSAAPATAGGAPSGKLSDQQLLDALKGMK